MGAKVDKVLDIKQAGLQPTYNEVGEALLEVCGESLDKAFTINDLRTTVHNLASWLTALANAHEAKDAWAVHDILTAYVRNRRPAASQAQGDPH